MYTWRREEQRRGGQRESGWRQRKSTFFLDSRPSPSKEATKSSNTLACTETAVGHAQDAASPAHAPRHGERGAPHAREKWDGSA